MALKFLLDTSVYSQPLRCKPLIAALEHWRDAGDAHCAISAVTLAEVEFGLHLEANPLRRQKFEGILRYRLPVLPTEGAVWSKFAQMKARQQHGGEPVSDLDLLIAATAITHNLCIATLNKNDFSRIESLAWEDWSR